MGKPDLLVRAPESGQKRQRGNLVAIGLIVIAGAGFIGFALAQISAGDSNQAASKATETCSSAVRDTGRSGRRSTITQISGVDCAEASHIVGKYMSTYQHSVYNIISEPEDVAGWTCSYPRRFPTSRPTCLKPGAQIVWVPVDNE